MPGTRFTRHAQTLIYDGLTRCDAPACGRDLPPAILPAHSAGAALTAALFRAEQGLPFRIGGTDLAAPDGVGSAGPPPLQGPLFETLTAGSSGAARRILRHQASWCASFAVNAGMFGIGPGDSVAVLGRLDHSLSLYGAVEGACLGASVHCLHALRPDRQRRRLAEVGAGILYATPAQLRLMLGAGGPDLPQLRRILVGGSKLDPPLRRALAQATPAVVHEFYGAAEASFITLSGPDCPDGSVGTPYPGVELELRDPGGLRLGEGALGEVWVRSPYVFAGYGGGAPPGTATRMRAGWLTVGEMGWLEGGALYLAGRAGRMFTVADQNVFPEQIEAALLAQAGVQAAAVLAAPDALRGAQVVAVVMGTPARESAILAALRAELGPLRAPRRLIWRSDWPTLPSGKADLLRLRREAGL